MKSFSVSTEGALQDLAKVGLIIVAFTIKDVWIKMDILSRLEKPKKWFCLKVKPKLSESGVRVFCGKASA
ncbi:hypothetical protein CHI08_15955 [Peribacillus simplex]|nr:hypothetical protein [Peribacillus simplex]PAK40107.1 hypothetical protein CHI08_15955 [Peribacillus simplex]